MLGMRFKIVQAENLPESLLLSNRAMSEILVKSPWL